MISNVTGVTPTCAPAGFLGLGSADARPYAAVGAAVRPDLDRRRAAVQGIGLPTGGVVPATPLDGTAAVATAPLAHRTGTKNFAQNDGTTLGIHSSRRPQS